MVKPFVSEEVQLDPEMRSPEVLDFERPVRLIPRPSVPRPKPAVAVLVGAAATVIAAWLYIRARRGDSRLG